MKPEEKAKELTNKYYQPLTVHLKINNNNDQMWEYAKQCALICVDEILSNHYVIWLSDEEREYWLSVKQSLKDK